MAKRYRESNNSTTFSLFRHRTTLYFVFFLSLTYLFYLLLMVDFPTIFFFGLVGLVTSFFSKNMIVVLSVALSLTLLMNYSGSLGNSLAATTVTKVVVVSDVNETLDVKNKEVDKGMLLDLKAQDRIPSGSPTPQLPMNVVLGEIPNGDAKNAPLEPSHTNFKEVGLTELGDKSLTYASL
jgi:hypothetical protein